MPAPYLSEPTKAHNGFVPPPRIPFDLMDVFTPTKKSSLTLSTIIQKTTVDEQYVQLQGRQYTLPATYPALKDELEGLDFLFHCQENWDGEGAVAIAADLVHAVVDSISAYAWAYNVMKYPLPDVEVNPVVDGTIDVAWYTPSAKLLMNYRVTADNHFKVYFFGGTGYDLNEEPIKGATTNLKVAPQIWEWMKLYMK